MSERELVQATQVALVVDDDPAQRLMLNETLVQLDLTVHEAKNGAEAVSLFQSLQPDLVMMDIRMPVMDGLEACQKIRCLPEGKDIPIVLMTAMDDHASIDRAFEVKATDFITKPVNWPILTHRVQYLLKASRTFRELLQSQTRLSAAQRIAEIGNWEWNIEDSKLYWSDQVYQIFGVSRSDFEPTFESYLSKVHPDDRRLVKKASAKALNQDGPLSIDHRIIRPDGSERTVHEEAEIILSRNGKPLSLQGTIQNITQRKQAEAQINHFAYYDTLTGLPNREHFKGLADQALKDAARFQSRVALMYLDLDEFKKLNDTMGHETGDDFLITIARTLSRSLRSTDNLAKLDAETTSTLSRLGGDEFIVQLTGFTLPEQVEKVAQRLLDRLCETIFVGEQEYYITGSMGIALYPDDGKDAETLLKNAEIAMYQAKKQGKNSFQFYTQNLNKHSKELLGMKSRLRKALQNNELLLHYQPQISVESGRVIGMEALVRWNDPGKGLISPGQFIPVAEESGLILPIGDWVLETACKQASLWQQAGLPPVNMSVNISSHQFRQSNFTHSVESILQRSQLDSKYLELEMTESIIMQQVDKTIKDLSELKQLGINLSIDDFGTGYSSMSYLKRFPLDTLKIDQSFVYDLTEDTTDEAIIDAIIALSKSLGLKTVAEGVETPAQLECLTELGCDIFQGYYISRPLPAEEAEKFQQNMASKTTETK